MIARAYSITSSARARSVGGIGRLRAFAVFRFTSLLNRQIGWACPFENSVDVSCCSARERARIWSVAHETTPEHVVFGPKHRRQPVLYRKFGNESAPR